MTANDSREMEIVRVTLWGAVLNCILTLFKIVSGFVGKSSAMVADGIHSLSDLVSDFIVIVFVRISGKGQDREHDYGHGKFETLASLIVSLILMFVGVKLFVGGVSLVYAFIGGDVLPVPSMIAFWMALVSIVSKELMFRVTETVGKRLDSMVVVANAWHHRTDAISSVASLVGIGAAIFFGDRWTVLDPLVSCIISIFIFFVAIRMCGTALSELMEASLSDEDEAEIVSLISSVDGINDVHCLKTRRNGKSVIIDVHIVVDPSITVAEAHDMTVSAEKLLFDRFGNDSQICMHIEPSEQSL